MVTMRLSLLTFDVFSKIVKIYDKVMGGNGYHYIHESDTERIKNTFEHSDTVRRKFGSKISPLSELRLNIASPFGNNDILIYFDISVIKGTKKERALEKKFKEEMEKFLRKEKLAN